jgi:hypothetical protein
VFNKHLRVWSTFFHPHVAQLYGTETDNGTPFFMYEYASVRTWLSAETPCTEVLFLYVSKS